MKATAFLHHTDSGRIFVAYFMHAPFPDQADFSFRRWRCGGYHTTGATGLVEAAEHMDAMFRDFGLSMWNTHDLGHLLWDGEAGLTLLTDSDNRLINATTVRVDEQRSVAQ
jgi:hypothetical protein